LDLVLVSLLNDMGVVLLLLVFELFGAMEVSVVLMFGSMDNQLLVPELKFGLVFVLDDVELVWDLVSLWSSQGEVLLSCMGASVLDSLLLVSLAPHDGKVVEELLLQLALWMYADREANLWAMVVMLAIGVFELLME